MRVLQINAVSGIRSTGRTSLEVADYLNQNGHEGYIAYSYGMPYEKGYTVGTLFEKKVHGLFSRIFGKQAYFSRRGTLKLLRYIESLKPDIIHLRNLHANYINLRMLLKYIADQDIPTVITLHDCWFYTGKCTHYTEDNCFKWLSGCFDCPRLKKDNPSWFFDKTPKMYDDKKEWFSKIPRLAIVGVSDWITNEARRSFLQHAKVVTRIYNWVDQNVFKPVDVTKISKKLGTESDFVILGVSSSWGDSKGLNKFIELSSLLPKSMKVVLVGKIDEKIIIPNNIVHIDETNDLSELAELYSLADVLLNLSAEETFGKVTVEALSCGTPAIVFNSTANPELIGEGCGYVLNDSKISTILKRIHEIQAKGKETYSQQCIDFVRYKFNKENRIMDYINLYEKLHEEEDIKC